MLWAVFWPLLDACWRFFGPSKSYLFKALVLDGLRGAFWMDLGLILKGLGKIFVFFLLLKTGIDFELQLEALQGGLPLNHLV